MRAVRVELLVQAPRRHAQGGPAELPRYVPLLLIPALPRSQKLSLTQFRLSCADRSPLNKASQITAPLLLLQGSEDRVVPPAQAQVMLDRIHANGGVADMIPFDGEGHGFRQKENRKRAMEKELEWYRKTWQIQEEKA